MTWFPAQAALKMSTIPGAIRATLDALLDHINPAPKDPTRPDTLTVWESRARLAAEAGFSEVTTREHLQRLRGETDLRKGQRVTVLKCVEAASSHRAARYELIPAALDALVDPVRLEAFEASHPRDTHPYQRWRQWRASQMAQADVGESRLPQAPADESREASLGISSLPQVEAVGERRLPQFGKAASPELPVVDLDTEELTIFVPNPASTAPEKKGSLRSPSPATTKTRAPDHVELTLDDYLWLRAEGMGDFQAVVGRTPQQAVNEWLEGCRAKCHTYADWRGEMRSYGLLRRYNGALNRVQERQAAAARREAWQAQVQAEADARRIAAADPWRCDQCGVRHATLACPT